jgi:hypothetical protein
MSSPAKKFIQKRQQQFALTQERVNFIFSYIHFCYYALLLSEVKYSRKWVKENTTDKYENYLKKKLVHDYLKKYKSIYPIKSKLEELIFECEPEMPYSYYNSGLKKKIEANDRIDIKVNRIGLQEIWKNIEDQDIYLAIECKILAKLSDNAQYLNDIQKFCDREHEHFRLPIEGMLAFIETKKIAIPEFVADVNNRLKKSKTISTKQFLSPILSNSFSDNYFNSWQLRNFNKALKFSICHLYLGYSEIIEA